MFSEQSEGFVDRGDPVVFERRWFHRLRRDRERILSSGE